MRLRATSLDNRYPARGSKDGGTIKTMEKAVKVIVSGWPGRRIGIMNGRSEQGNVGWVGEGQVWKFANVLGPGARRPG
jgi:hypothetical protein